MGKRIFALAFTILCTVHGTSRLSVNDAIDEKVRVERWEEFGEAMEHREVTDRIEKMLQRVNQRITDAETISDDPEMFPYLEMEAAELDSELQRAVRNAAQVEAAERDGKVIMRSSDWIWTSPDAQAWVSDLQAKRAAIENVRVLFEQHKMVARYITKVLNWKQKEQIKMMRFMNKLEDDSPIRQLSNLERSLVVQAHNIQGLEEHLSALDLPPESRPAIESWRKFSNLDFGVDVVDKLRSRNVLFKWKKELFQMEAERAKLKEEVMSLSSHE